MPNEPDIQSILDEREIARVVNEWGYLRDAEEWERLGACFHPDAEMHISWTTGSARSFIESLKRRPPRQPGEHTKHFLGMPRIQQRGSRAVSECHATVLSRVIIDGFEFDFEAWLRFLDLFENRVGAWRIFKRTAIYEKDRMEPVVPGEVPESFFSSVDMKGYPTECRFMCLRHTKQGRPFARNIVGVYSEAERALRAASRDWLAGK